jgi:hypothetical protein
VVRPEGQEVKLWVYTEDSGEASWEVIRRLLPRLLLLVDGLTQTHRLRVLRAEGGPRDAMNAHRWRGRDRRGEALRRELVRELVARLRHDELVVFHHDGDCPWAGGPGSPDHDPAVEGLFDELRRALTAKGPAPGEGPLPGLLRLVPHASIEAWLYLHAEKVERLAAQGKAEAAAARVWLAEQLGPEGLDHVDQPKDSCPLRDKHNPALADGWPAERAAQRSPSLRHTVEAWRADPRLRRKLTATNPWAAPPAP